jgi:hypothetical protein
MAWDDYQGNVTDGVAGAALTYEAYRDTSLRLLFFRYNQDDELHFKFQLPHRWDPRRNVHPHMHVIPMANGAGNVRIDGWYYWNRSGVAIPAVASWTGFTVDTGFDAADQYIEQHIELGNISPPAGANESSILLMYVRRPGASDAADTYQTNKDHGTVQANLGILSTDLHYEPVKLGTQNEYGPV